MRRLLDFFATPAGRVLRYVISVLLLVGLMVSMDWSKIVALQGHLTTGPILLAALAAGATYPLHAWRWWALLRAQDVPLSFGWTHVATWIGTFYNAFLAGGLGGDAARAFYVCRDAPEKRAGGLMAILLDRAMGLAMLLGLAAIALAARFDTFAQRSEFRPALLAGAVAIAVGCAAIFFLRRPPAWLTAWLGAERAKTISEVLAAAANGRGALVTALLVSVAIWLLDFFSVWLLARGIGLPLPFDDVCFAMAIAYAATALPLSVGGHGVREGAMFAVLAALGLLPDDDARQLALLLGILVWALTMLWSLVGGLVLIGARGWRPGRPA